MEGGNDEIVVSALDKVTAVVPDLFDLAGTCFDAVLANPILTLYFGIGMIGVGLGVFRMLKRTARH